MLKYIKADILRIYKRAFHNVMLVIMAIIVLIFVWDSPDSYNTMTSLYDQMISAVRYGIVPIGVLGIIFSFADDFKAKTAQIAIGIGIPRHEVIFAKWLETMVMALLDYVILMLFGVVANLLLSGSKITPSQWGHLFVAALVEILTLGAFMGLTMFVAYTTKGVIFPILLYVFLSAGAINSLISKLDYIDMVQKSRITHYTMTSLSDYLGSNLYMGNLLVKPLIGLLLYCAVWLVLVWLVFRKQELDF